MVAFSLKVFLQDILANSRLRNICAIETVHAIRSYNSLLCLRSYTFFQDSLSERVNFVLDDFHESVHILELHTTTLCVEVKPVYVNRWPETVVELFYAFHIGFSDLEFRTPTFIQQQRSLDTPVLLFQRLEMSSHSCLVFARRLVQDRHGFEGIRRLGEIEWYGASILTERPNLVTLPRRGAQDLLSFHCIRAISLVVNASPQISQTRPFGRSSRN